MRFIFALILISFCTSCAIHYGSMTGNAALSNANFDYVDFAIGSASTVKIFGIGGLGTDALVLEAKRNLYLNYPLKKGQALANVSVDIKRAFYVVMSRTKVVISADIVDFNQDSTEVDYAALNNKIIGGKISEVYDFKVGEEVYAKVRSDMVAIVKAKVSGFKRNRCQIQYFDLDDKLRTVYVGFDMVFKTTSIENNAYKRYIGDIVTFSTMKNNLPKGLEKITGTIIGLNRIHVLVEYNKNKRAIVSYSKLE